MGITQNAIVEGSDMIMMMLVIKKTKCSRERRDVTKTV